MRISYLLKPRRLLPVLLASLLISGCQAPPAEAEKPYIPYADVPLESTVSVRLHYLSEQDGEMKLSPLMSEVRVEDGGTLEEAAIEKLMQQPETGYLPVSEASWSLDTVDVIHNYNQNVGQKIAFINILAQGNIDPGQLSVFRSACAETLLQLSKVDYVMLTVNNELPVGMEGIKSTNSSESAVSETPILLYYPDAEGKYAMPTVRMISGDNTGIEKRVFNELEKGSDNNSLGRMYPSNILCHSIEWEEDGDEINVVLGGPSNYLKNDMAQQKIWNECFALSLLSNIEGCSTVTISFKTNLNSDFIPRKWTYGIKYLNQQRGGFVQFYLEDKETPSLLRTQRVLSFEKAADPYACVGEILIGPQAGEDNMRRVAPEGAVEGDFLGCRIYNDTVVVNFSQRFYDRCIGMRDYKELMLVYAITNALTDHPSVTQVQFVCEGVVVDSLAGYIILARPLLRNPGIIR